MQEHCLQMHQQHIFNVEIFYRKPLFSHRFTRHCSRNIRLIWSKWFRNAKNSASFHRKHFARKCSHRYRVTKRQSWRVIDLFARNNETFNLNIQPMWYPNMAIIVSRQLRKIIPCFTFISPLYFAIECFHRVHLFGESRSSIGTIFILSTAERNSIMVQVKRYATRCALYSQQIWKITSKIHFMWIIK